LPARTAADWDYWKYLLGNQGWSVVLWEFKDVVVDGYFDVSTSRTLRNLVLFEPGKHRVHLVLV